MSNRTIIDVPLDRIAIHPNQPKTRNDVKALAESIKAIGLVEPITCVATAGASPDEPVVYMIVSGHRRYAAVKMTGATDIPVQVITYDEATSEAQFNNTVKQLVSSNTNREDFTAVEQADALQGMLELGMSLDDVISATGMSNDEVVKASAASLNVKPAIKKKLARDADLTLDELSVLATYPLDVDELLAAREDGQFWHVQARLARAKQAADNIAAAAAELEKEACEQIPKPAYDDKHIVSLDKIGITKENHKMCKGHAAYITTDYQGKAYTTYVCTDAPANHNYKAAARSEHEQADLDKAREGREFKKDGAAPTDERRRWILEKLNAGTEWKKHWGFLCYAVAHRATATSELALLWSGVKKPEGVAWTDVFGNRNEPKAARAVLAMALAHMDEECRLCQGIDHFRATHVATFLKFLQSNGYVLSLHEEQFLV